MPRDIDKELGIDETLAMEASQVSVRVERRRYGKNMTLLEGFDPSLDVDRLAKDLKSHLGTGGTAKDGVIELQGDHREKAKAWLEKAGFSLR